jgi:uncharacterized membrane protein
MALPNQDLATVRTISRWALGAALALAGVGHLTTLRREFQAQVPDWFPVDADLTVVVSGVVEIALGASLVAMSKRRVTVGLLTAAFFVVIFPGNVAQWIEGKDGFGLDTDAARFARLFFQPVLIAWALWSTGAGGALARWIRSRR